MVTIVDFQKRKNSGDKEFNVLIFHGDLEVVMSKESGKPYFSARKTSIPCTFDEVMAKTLVGKTLTDGIQKLDSEEYEFTIELDFSKYLFTFFLSVAFTLTGIANANSIWQLRSKT